MEQRISRAAEALKQAVGTGTLDPDVEEQVLKILDALRSKSAEGLREVGQWADPLRELMEEDGSGNTRALRLWAGEELMALEASALDPAWAAHQAAARFLGMRFATGRLEDLIQVTAWVFDTTSSLAEYAVGTYQMHETPPERERAMLDLFAEARSEVTPGTLEPHRAEEWWSGVLTEVRDVLDRAETLQAELLSSTKVRLVLGRWSLYDPIEAPSLARGLRAGQVLFADDIIAAIVPDAAGAYLATVGARASDPFDEIPAETMEVAAALWDQDFLKPLHDPNQVLQAARDIIR